MSKKDNQIDDDGRTIADMSCLDSSGKYKYSRKKTQPTKSFSPSAPMTFREKLRAIGAAYSVILPLVIGIVVLFAIVIFVMTIWPGLFS